MNEPPAVFVTLRESTVAILMALRTEDETLDAVTVRCVDAARKASVVASTPAPAPPLPSPAEPLPPAVATASTWPTATSGKRVASVLGVPVGARTYGQLLGNVVDAIHYLDPVAIERLSGMKADTRRYVARDREDVHDRRLDLPTLRTRSNWWVSANIGEKDFVRSLRALCRASGLTYGQDICFPVRSEYPTAGESR